MRRSPRWNWSPRSRWPHGALATAALLTTAAPAEPYAWKNVRIDGGGFVPGIGVLSIAPDPVDTDRVYAEVGMHTDSWDPNNGAVLRSADKGWGGTATRSGAAVTVVNAGYNGALSSGASTTFGFLGGTTGTTNPVPSPITCST